jgi:hypothetical protein
MRNIAKRPSFAGILLLSLALGGGCSTPFQGIKVRAQSPGIDEAFRKLSLAVTTDGYTIASVDLIKHTLESGWKGLTPKELSDADRKTGNAKIEGKLMLRLDARGKLYDLFLTPVLRYSREGESPQQEIIAGVRHPLREKWEMAIARLIEKETKEED